MLDTIPYALNTLQYAQHPLHVLGTILVTIPYALNTLQYAQHHLISPSNILTPSNTLIFLRCISAPLPNPQTGNNPNTNAGVNGGVNGQAPSASGGKCYAGYLTHNQHRLPVIYLSDYLQSTCNILISLDFTLSGLSDVAVAFIVITVLVVVGAVALLVVIKNRKEAAAGNGGLPTAAVAVKVCAQSFFHPPLMVPCLMVVEESQGIIGNYREL
jgi:hypothetical protein